MRTLSLLALLIALAPAPALADSSAAAGKTAKANLTPPPWSRSPAGPGRAARGQRQGKDGGPAG